MDGKIQISDALLKLDYVQASGNVGKQNTAVIHSIPSEEPPYRLTVPDSSQLRFSLNSIHYDALDFHLFLAADNYQLILKDNVEESAPVPRQTDDGETGNSDDDDGQYNGGNQNENDGDADDDESDDDSGEENDEDGDDGNDTEHDGDDDDHDRDKDNKKNNKGDKDKNKNENKNKGKNKGHDKNGGKIAGSTSQSVDLDDFFQNAKPGMVVLATYMNNGKIINIVFVGSGIGELTIRAKQNDSFAISLSEQNSAEITFDPAHWFDSLTPALIESADIQIYQQQNIVLIHENFNSTLYKEISSRIEGSATLTINKGTSDNL